jgi:hypothetical protein
MPGVDYTVPSHGSAPGSTVPYLLEDPTIAIGIPEPGERAVVAPIRVGARDLVPWRVVIEDPADVMEYVGNVYAEVEESRTCFADVRHNQLQTLDRARDTVRDAIPENDRRLGSGGRELYDTKVVARRVIEILAEPNASVERLRAIDIRDWEHDDLELHVHESTPADG